MKNISRGREGVRWVFFWGGGEGVSEAKSYKRICGLNLETLGFSLGWYYQVGYPLWLDMDFFLE